MRLGLLRYALNGPLNGRGPVFEVRQTCPWPPQLLHAQCPAPLSPFFGGGGGGGGGIKARRRLIVSVGRVHASKGIPMSQTTCQNDVLLTRMGEDISRFRVLGFGGFRV